ncbi:transglycosylase domain-containing protein [Nesterenkonia muleiensis]|uniref:transglycosylase domain-containing protein n=1 Tax=Nesterenkonia muleiensis TaxID=2282648 RepID=UPI000E711AE7|nr:transglycosylase domain-containing protein [Nesterenkonia muleiensis]
MPRKPGLDTASTVGKVLSFLGISAVCGALAAGLLFPLAATGGAAASLGDDVLDEHPVQLREAPLSTPSVIEAADGTEIARFYAENREPVSLDEISQEMQDAIVSIEDERFYEHSGTDVRALARAAVSNMGSGPTEGGSTITHQYVSLILLNADYLEGRENLVMGGTTTVADRFNEARLAADLETQMTKEEILEGYLNIVLLGQQNYGVEAAAQHYWGIPASELDIAQSATLAGMVQAPNYYDPQANPEAAANRRNVVLETMVRNGYISEEQREEAAASDLDLDPHPAESGCVSAAFAPYFCDYVQRLILDDEAFGETREERETLLLRGGLRIATTLDPQAQDEAQRHVDNTVPPGDSSGAVATLTSVEPTTGNILTMAQSTVYHPEGDEAAGRTTMNFNVDFAYGDSGGFPVGSTLKPFVAAAWLEEGGAMDDVIDASITEYDYGQPWEASCMPGGEVQLLADGTEDDSNSWEIVNVVNGMEQEMTLDYGLFYSVNTATVATAHQMDLCAITDLTERLDIRSAGNGELLTPNTPAFVLGAIELSPMTLATAYATFANDGVRCEERALVGITDGQGNDYPVPETTCEEVIDPDIAAQVNDTLINIAEQSIAAGNPAFPMTGKTGTSNTGSNTWFVGSTEGMTTAAQIGRTDGIRPLRGNTINGQYYERLFGSTLAAPMWNQYMNSAAGSYRTGDFLEAQDSPFDDRRANRYSGSGAGAGAGAGAGG